MQVDNADAYYCASNDKQQKAEANLYEASKWISCIVGGLLVPSWKSLSFGRMYILIYVRIYIYINYLFTHIIHV